MLRKSFGTMTEMIYIVNVIANIQIYVHIFASYTPVNGIGVSWISNNLGSYEQRLRKHCIDCFTDPRDVFKVIVK